MSDFVQANTNGRLHDAAQPSLSPLNRGFLYGDAIYEVWRTYGGCLFGWEEHWERLRQSAGALALEIPISPEELRGEIRRTAAAYREQSGCEGDLYIRLQIYRGEGAIGLDIALASPPGFVLLVKAVPQLSVTGLEQGLTLSIATGLRRNDISTLNPAWKTGNYLNNLLCLQEAKQRGADDVLILNQRGEITEASTANIGFIQGDRFITPPLGAGILAGVTRRLILQQVAATAQLSVEERMIRPEELAEMEECMLLSSTKDVQPVGRVDDIGFRVGADSRTRQLKTAFQAYVVEALESRTDLHV